MLSGPTRHYLSVRDRLVEARLRKKEGYSQVQESDDYDESSEDMDAEDDAALNKAVIPAIMSRSNK